MDLLSELFAITDALHAEDLDYAVCGGLAVVIHGYPRLTQDIDILIREEDLDMIADAVSPAGYTVKSGIIPFDLGKETERRIFRITKFVQGESEYLTLDLILATGFLQEIWEEREQYEIEGRVLQVVSRDGLKKMKRTAGRPRDIDDLENLE